MSITRPSEEIAALSRQYGIGHIPEMVGDAVRFPWKLHGSFSVGCTFPPYLIIPLVKSLSDLQRCFPRPNILGGIRIRDSLRRHLRRKLHSAIARINSTPERLRWSEFERRLGGLDLEPHLPIDIAMLAFDTTRLRVIFYHPGVYGYSWKNHTLVSLLFDLLPFLPAEELAKPGQVWSDLYRFHRATREYEDYTHSDDRERMRINTRWHLTVYEACLSRLAVMAKKHSGLALPTSDPQWILLSRLLDQAAQPAVV